ncbi:MAG: IPT/TIG domain-containing protein, partial [Bradymonadaceae bacterium]|nr:IPT/TIG domain-containing protein [Lujinxingiaceae bacterium]
VGDGRVYRPTGRDSLLQGLPVKFARTFKSNVVLLAIWAGALLSACSSDSDGPSLDRDASIVSPDTDAQRDATHTPDTTQTQPDTVSVIDTGRRPPRDGGPAWDWDVDDDNHGLFQLDGVIPPTGPVSGGTRVQLRGRGFDVNTRVFFGSQEMVVRLSGAHLIGKTPPASGPGPVSIRAIAPDGTTRNLTDGFDYTADISVDSIVPRRLPTQGGVEVQIHGNGFASPMGVSFSGRSAARVEVVHETLLRVVVPAHPRGLADLRLTSPSQSVVIEQAVEYYEPLSIERVTPSSGPLAGGQSVTLQGKGFNSATEVYFGQARAQVQSVDAGAGSIRVLTPAASAGLSAVSVKNATDNFRLDDAYFYRANGALRLGALHPNFGPTTGGTEVWLVGYGFDVANLRIRFGATLATVINAGPDHALVRAPAGSVGSVDVVMLSGTNELDRVVNGFDYRAAITIDSLTPTTGSATGNQSVTIKGSGFSGAERVYFGTLSAGFQIISPTEIRATTPAHGAGLVDVVVSANGIEARRKDAYRFTDSLEVWGFSPVRGAIAGGTYVALRGTGFSGLLSVDLGGKAATEVRRLDDNNLYFMTPAQGPGEVTVELTAGDLQARAPYPFVYFNPINTFGGASGAEVLGSVNITVLAMGGSAVANAFVMLSTRSETPYQGLTDANGQLTLSGPGVLGAQTVTATAAGHSTTTLQAIDAENITIFLMPLDGEGGGAAGDPPPFGTISGKIINKGKRANHEGDGVVYDMAIVRTTQAHIQGPVMNPGPGSMVLRDESTYEIRSRVGDIALIGLCGTYNETTDTFTADFMAVERFMNVTNRGTYRVDLECDIALDQTAQVKLINPIYSPQGPDNNIVNIFWNFGFEGVYPSPTRGRGLDSVLEIPGQPSQDGELADISHIVVGGSYTSNFAPYTQTSRTNIADFSEVVALPPLLDVPELVSPHPGGTVVNNRIRFRASGPYYPDFFWVVVRNLQGMPIWQFIVPGTETMVTLPEFPSFAHLPYEQRPEPLAPGPLYLVIYGVRIPNFTYESFSYNDLSAERWEAFSVASWVIQLLP